MSRATISRLERLTAKAYYELAPAPLLTPFVDRFWHGAASENRHFQHFSLIPDGCVDVVYEVREQGVHCLVFGTTSYTQPFQIAQDAHYFGVRFRPGMARHFLTLQPGELTDLHIDLPVFLGLKPEEIAEAETDHAQRALMERTLVESLHRQNATLTPFDQAIRHVQQNPEVGRVESLAEMCGLSPRQVERTVLATIGLSPKRLLRILRVQSAIAAIHRAPQNSLADVASALGYSDQAHMNRDFRLLADSTPSQYRLAFLHESCSKPTR
jgi:AraC-like DNA-binding protein